MADPEPQPELSVKAAPTEDDLPPLPEEPPVQDAAPLPWDEPARPAPPAQPEAAPSTSAEKPAPAPVQPSAEHPADPALNKPRRVAAEGINPFPQWDEVVRLLQEKDPMLYTYLRKVEGLLRRDPRPHRRRKDLPGLHPRQQGQPAPHQEAHRAGVRCSRAHRPLRAAKPSTASATNAEESLRRLEQLGVDVSIEESAKKKR